MALLEALQLITGVFVVVHEGEHGVKFTLGKAGQIVEPGINFKWPIIQKFVVQCTRDTSLRLSEQTIQVADGLVYTFSACLIYRITNLRKAVVEISDVREGLCNLIEAAIQEVLMSKDRTQVMNIASISEHVKRIIKSKAEHWGVEVTNFGFSDLAPTKETAQIIQTQLMGKERYTVYQELLGKGLNPSVAAALVSGASMIVQEQPKNDS